MPIDRAAAFREDILAEPDTLARLLDAYGSQGSPMRGVPATDAIQRIVFAGLGSSRFAALDAATELRAHGYAAWAEFASTDRPAPPAHDVLLVAISASGATSETVDAADRHRGTSLVVAITNEPGSALAERADLVLPLLAGTETSGVACRTYLHTVAVLALLSWRLRGVLATAADLLPAVDAIGQVIAGRSTWLEPAVELLDRAPAIGVLGPGSRVGLAEQCSLMLREAPRLPASAHEAGDWHHTAIYTALPGYRAVLMPGVGGADALATTIRGRGGATLAIGTEGTGAELTIPLPATSAADEVGRLVPAVVAELLAAELWSRATAVQLKGP